MLGALPSQKIQELIDQEIIKNTKPEHIQPSSLDLTLADEIYEIEGVLLPKKRENIHDILNATKSKKVSFAEPLKCGKIYCVKLSETLNLPQTIFAYTNNKSSTGRINLQVRLICDSVPLFDYIPKGYSGDLWAYLSSHSFSVKLQPGQTLNQMRLCNTDNRMNEQEHHEIYQAYPLLYDETQKPIPVEEVIFDKGGGITLTIDLEKDIIGYVAHQQPEKIIDYGSQDHDPKEYFQVLYNNPEHQITLDSEGFYIFATKEHISVPPEFAVEMIPYDPSKGEFRSHYAGFFDPGFGYGKAGEKKGTPAVMEVYPRGNNVIFRDGQPICKMVYERLSTFPTRIYGIGELKSNYAQQHVLTALSKHFKKE